MDIDVKKQGKIFNKVLRFLKSKKGAKISSFSMLSKALKISAQTLRKYEVNKNSEIIDMLAQSRHGKNTKVSQKKCEKNTSKITAKNVAKNNILKAEVEAEVENKSGFSKLRSFEEIKTKLFIYEAWKKKEL